MIFKLPHQKEKAISYIERIDKEMICEVRKDKRNRSVVQNNYMWMLLTMLEQETGQDKNDLHFYFKSTFIGVDLRLLQLPDGLHKITEPESTTKLTTIEFEDYLEKIRVFASRELGIFLPLPGETVHDYLNLK